MTASAFSVSSRVRIRRSLVQGVLTGGGDDVGTVIRNDPRGILVRLDSGKTAMCEPGLLVPIQEAV